MKNIARNAKDSLNAHHQALEVLNEPTAPHQKMAKLADKEKNKPFLGISGKLGKLVTQSIGNIAKSI